MKSAAILIVAISAFSFASARASEDSNPLFSYTHLLPSPIALPSGMLVIGTDAAFGLTDFLQIGTGVLRDLYQFYNVNTKLALIDYPSFALALTGAWETYNYRSYYSENPDLQITSLMPGLVTSYELLPRLALFVGGNLNFTSEPVRSDLAQTSGYLHGAEVESDIAWAYNHPGKHRRIGNVLATGVSYDVTYKLWGVGLSHYWPGFHVGFHYYPAAQTGAVQPILAGGGAIQF